MAERHNPPFDLDAIAEGIGYPLFMKPFDGGTWTAVTRVVPSSELHRSYEESGERLMHPPGGRRGLRRLHAQPLDRPADEGRALRRDVRSITSGTRQIATSSRRRSSTR